MNEQEFMVELARKDDQIKLLSKQVMDLTLEIAKLKNAQTEQNMYIGKLESKLMEKGAW